ncbi:ABC transporter permease [Enterococcus sp. LJL128]|uniref:ABC transporter permease n=1 Tax=Enterococcus sp. LJL51 TaxID=3416656 RepID=UPI003CF2012D
MSLKSLLWRNMKWRYHYRVTVFVTIIQPLIWLLLYSTVVSGADRVAYTSFILPGIMILVMLGACSSSGMMNYMTKNEGSFQRLLRAPVSRTSIISAQNLEAVVLSFIEIFLLMIISLGLSVRFQLSVSGGLLAILILFLTGFFMANVAYSISLKLPNEIIYETVMNMIVLPLFFASTALLPLENISDGIRWLVLLNPFTHVIEALRRLLNGQSLPLKNTLFLIILLVVLCIMGLLFSKHMLKKESSK